MIGAAEPELECPVPLQTLNTLNRSDVATVLSTVKAYSEEQRVRLALYCYNRSHLRTLALTVASSVDPARLSKLAGTMGEVLASQCQASGLSFGTEPPNPDGSRLTPTADTEMQSPGQRRSRSGRENAVPP